MTDLAPEERLNRYGVSYDATIPDPASPDPHARNRVALYAEADAFTAFDALVQVKTLVDAAHVADRRKPKWKGANSVVPLPAASAFGSLIRAGFSVVCGTTGMRDWTANLVHVPTGRTGHIHAGSVDYLLSHLKTVLESPDTIPAGGNGTPDP